MSYVVLARKWRPQSFDDLAGQGHVSTTLENAIATNRVAHAFLFTGVRGVGKTTSARILAKALNCAKGPTAHPCQVCPQCTEITIGQDLDVQEIDGASYNGVDEVRRLQETLPYRPARDRFKIFIVDEVHMLSNAAWNAFLKTLEEPPPHVKFIFATTEVHKVPVTILSRCQRYDFKLIGASTIAARLRFVLGQEKVAFDEPAIHIIAREAAGSMRDAMSLLDQVLASIGGAASDEGGSATSSNNKGDEKLTAEGVARVLGVADRVVLHKLAGSLVAGDAGSCLGVINDLAQEGYDLPHVARDFLGHLRDLVVAKVAADPGKLLELADEELADVKALAEGADVDDLARLHQGFSRAFDDITKGGQPRQALEMTLVRLSRRPPLLPVEELLRRLGDLERRLLGGGPAGGGGSERSSGGPRGGGGGAPPARRPGGPSASAPEGPTQAVAPVPAKPAPPPKPAPMAPSHPASAPLTPAMAPSHPASAPQSPPMASSHPASTSLTPAMASSHSASTPLIPAMAPSHPASAPLTPAMASSHPASASQSPPMASSDPSPASVRPESDRRPGVGAFGPALQFSAPVPKVQPPPPSGQGAPPQQPQGGPKFNAPQPAAAQAPRPVSPPPVAGADLEPWRAIVHRVRARRAALASVLEHAAVLAVGPTGIVIGYEKTSFLVGQATEPAARELLLAEVAVHYGARVEVTFETVERGHGALTLAQIEGAERKERTDAARKAIEDHPLVTAAIRMLGAELKDVRLAEAAEV